MGRIPRIIMPGEAHHVTQRGNRRQNVFFCAEDYHNYLKLLWANAQSFKFSVWSYCLMPNHIHLLIVPESEEALRNGMSMLHQAYTTAINKARGWKGHLWQGRFFSCLVESAGVAAVARYIELNPVRAGLAGNAAEYPWSSAQISCAGKNGLNGFAPITAPGGTWTEYLEYEPFGDRHEILNRIRQSVRTGRPFATEEYLDVIERKTGLKLKPQKRGRKPHSLESKKGRPSGSPKPSVIVNQSGGTN
jgi:putative transposase